MARVALVATAPMLRDGLAELIRSAGAARVVGSFTTIAEVVRAVPEVDVLVVQLDEHLDAIARLGPVLAGLDDVRVVGVHDTLSSRRMHAALEAGVTTLVDTSSATQVFLDAVAGVEQRTLRRWAPASIGPMPLTPRERSVLTLIAGGLTSRDVAAELAISTRTVEKHKQRIFDRLGVQNQAQAVAVAVRAGLLERAEAGVPAATLGGVA